MKMYSYLLKLEVIKIIDLHTHTNISDGSYSPSKLIKEAKKSGLSVVAITDHDSVDGLDEAEREAKRMGIGLIKGIEFSVSFGKDRLIHILGLGIDKNNDTFLQIYLNYRKERASKLDYVHDELLKMGVDILKEDLEPFVTIGYPERQSYAKCLVSKGYAKDMKHAWMDYLDHIPYAKGELIEPKEAIDAIHAAKGKAFLAHFHLPIGLKGYSEEEKLEKLDELKNLGLDGLEYYYPSFLKKHYERLDKYVKQFGFLKSGGTDFHGANRPNIKLGIGEGDFSVPKDILLHFL